jgi:hypothetical protein
VNKLFKTGIFIDIFILEQKHGIKIAIKIKQIYKFNIKIIDELQGV